jgi:glycosyltransferase involved in cell wall biosynthesis
MALGVPVVVARTTGMASLIHHGRDGLLVEAGDENGLVEALSHMQDDAFVSRMGAAAYDGYWRDPLTLERHVTRSVDAYRGMLGLAWPEEVLGRTLRPARPAQDREDEGRRGAA